MAKPKKPKVVGYIVMWDDDTGLCYPMGWDPDCEGAICFSSDGVALFPGRGSAKRAVAITRQFALLLRAQVKPYNSDFVEGLKYIKIRPVYEAGKDGE